MKYTSGGLTTDFDSKQAASKTIDDFVAHEKHLGFSDDQLKEVHALCVREQKPQAKVKEEDKTN